MTVAADAETGHMNGASRVFLRWGLVAEWCHDQGADSDIDRAKLFDVNRMTVGRWKRGDTGVSLPVARRVAQAMGLQLDQVIDDGNPNPNPNPPPPQPPNPGGPGREADQ